MSFWITLYCRRSVGHVDTRGLQAGILGKDPSALAGVDYVTLAEDYGIEEEEVDDALSNLEVKQIGGQGFERYEVDYSDGWANTVIVHRWHEPKRVAEEIDEVIERLAISRSALVGRLRESCEVVGIELKVSQLEDMGIVIAYEIARYLGQLGDSLALTDEDEWLQVKDGGFMSVRGNSKT